MQRQRLRNGSTDERRRIRVSATEKERAFDPIEKQMHFPRLSGGQLCLDFVNTIEPRIGKHSQDVLTSYSTLIKWSQYAELVTEEGARVLLDEAQYRQEEATALLTQVLTLREAIYRIFSALIRHTTPAFPDMQILQTSFLEAMAHACLVPTTHGIEWQWKPAEKELDQLLWSLSRSAVALLTSSEIKRVKECPSSDGGCGWLFVDRSKNGSRRWCSDEECGSLVRMRRLYARKRESKSI